LSEQRLRDKIYQEGLEVEQFEKERRTVQAQGNPLLRKGRAKVYNSPMMPEATFE
jgi:hypothetical protein